MDEATLLRQGIAAARAKRKSEAYSLLRQVVGMDPRNTEAWIWLGAVAPTLHEQLQAFEQAAALDPSNEKAQAGRRWAASKLGVSAAPSAPPPAPAAPGGGMSSQDMLGMFGGMPGAAPAPAPSAPSAPGGGRMSSQEMMNVFGGPGQAPAAPPPPAPGGGGMSSQEMMSIFGGQGSAAPSAPLDSMTPPSSMPPGAPGTPGGAEWRGFSELEEPNTDFNWDDPGVGLGGYAAPATAATDVSPFSWSDVATPPPRQAPPLPAPLPPPGAPSEDYGLDSLADIAQEYAYPPPLDEAAPPAARPRGTFSGWVVIAGIVLILVLILISLLLGTRLFASLQGAPSGPDAVVNSFLEAHLNGRYLTAADFLTEPLRAGYTQESLERLPGVPQLTPGQRWTKRVAPLAVAGDQAQVYAFFAPAGRANAEGPPVRFLLARAGNRWLISGVVPPPPVP